MKEMYFVQCSEAKLRSKVISPKGANYELLRKFADSGMAYAEVKNFKHKDAGSCRASLSKFMERHREKGHHDLDNIRIHAFDGKVYLINILYGEDI